MAKIVWNDGVRQAFLNWHDYRVANPDNTGLGDLDLRNAFYHAVYHDMMVPWLYPDTNYSPPKFWNLGGNWDGRCCESSAAVCQPVSQGNMPDPYTGGETGQFGAVPINPMDPDASQPSSNPQCYSNTQVVAKLRDLQQQAMISTTLFLANLEPPSVSPATITEAQLNAWGAPFFEMYNLYLNLWVNTTCGLAAPTQLSPTTPHPLPAPLVPIVYQ